MAPDARLLDAVRAALRAAADPQRAPAMQDYMKSTMPFLGVPRPAFTAALRPVWAAHPPRDRATWEDSVRALWDDAAAREERYAALALLSARPARGWHDSGLVPLLEHLAVTGAWWDLVDDVASHHVAPLHRADPDALAPVLRRWSVADDLWLRRAAILGQLGSGAGTDRDLLREVIAANLPGSAYGGEFFVRKAIGWALRDLAHRDPDWVRAYLAEQGQALSPLSRREAGRHLAAAPS
ncbi:MAG: DNA alkylation repair protein [Frankiales bacterium]|nr:DNA alkylation repair protein [Frankiales bacterium]